KTTATPPDTRQHEAGEGHSHAPGRCPSPASLAGAVASSRLHFPMQARATSHSPTSPTSGGFRETMAKKSPARIFPWAKILGCAHHTLATNGPIVSKMLRDDGPPGML